MNEKEFDAIHEADRIMQLHLAGYMSGCVTEIDDVEALSDMMTEECAYILLGEWKDKVYTPLQANAVRNELTKLIGELCYPTTVVEKEV